MRLTPHEPPGKCILSTPIHPPAPEPPAVRSLTGGGRSTQCGSCGGPARRRSHNELTHLFGIDTQVDYDAVSRLVAVWESHAGVVYFHLLLDSLSQAGLVDEA
jgi:hypothetical protein